MTTNNKDNFNTPCHLECRKVANISREILKRTRLSTHSLSLRTVEVLDEPEGTRKGAASRRASQKEKTTTPEEIESVGAIGTEDAWGPGSFLRALALQAALPFFSGTPFPPSSQHVPLSEPESDRKNGQPILEKEKENILNRAPLKESGDLDAVAALKPSPHFPKEPLSALPPKAPPSFMKPESKMSPPQKGLLEKELPVSTIPQRLPARYAPKTDDDPKSNETLLKTDPASPLSPSKTPSPLRFRDPLERSRATQIDEPSQRFKPKTGQIRAYFEEINKEETIFPSSKTALETQLPILSMKKESPLKQAFENGTQNLRSILSFEKIGSPPTPISEKTDKKCAISTPSPFHGTGKEASIEKPNLTSFPFEKTEEPKKVDLKQPEATLSNERPLQAIEKKGASPLEKPHSHPPSFNEKTPLPQVRSSRSPFGAISRSLPSFALSNPFASFSRKQMAPSLQNISGGKQIPMGKRTVFKMRGPSKVANISPLPFNESTPHLSTEKEEMGAMALLKEEPEFVATLYEQPILIENYFSLPQV